MLAETVKRIAGFSLIMSNFSQARMQLKKQLFNVYYIPVIILFYGSTTFTSFYSTCILLTIINSAYY